MKRLSVITSTAVLLAVFLSATGHSSPAREDPPATRERLKELVHAFPDSGLLHVRLASVYFAEGTVNGRYLATKHLKRALRIDPDNNRFRLFLAEVYFQATFWSRAVRELERILLAEPGNGFARCRLGCAYLERAIEEWQEEQFRRARRELSLVEQSHPCGAKARRKLALCHFDLGKPDSAILVLEALPADSLDKEALLVLGMAYEETGDLLAADRVLAEALERMGANERDRYLSVDLIATSQELDRMTCISPARPDSEWYLFWRKRDPNPATLYNERFVEHLARVAFADLHFSVPRLHKPGSLTTRGEVFIRYGRPLAWFYDPFGTNTFADDTVMPLTDRTHFGPGLRPDQLLDNSYSYRSRPLRVEKSRWLWKYRDFVLDFEDTFLNGDYTFPYERDWSAYTYAYLEREIPEIYEDQIKKRMRVVMEALNRLDEQGKPKLTVVYACDTRGIDYQPDYEWPEGEFEVRIALLDTSYADLVRSSCITKLAADSSAMYRTMHPIISSSDFVLSPGNAIAAVSIRSQSNQAMGFTSGPITVREFGEGLQVSDIELRFTGDGPTNPSHVYLLRGHAHLAFEIYNLAVDRAGTGHAEVSYQIIRRREEPGVARRIMSHLGLGSPPEESTGIASVESGYRLRSLGSTRLETIGLDLAPLSKGIYDVHLTVKDLISGDTATAGTTFRIASELRP